MVTTTVHGWTFEPGKKLAWFNSPGSSLLCVFATGEGKPYLIINDHTKGRLFSLHVFGDKVWVQVAYFSANGRPAVYHHLDLDHVQVIRELMRQAASRLTQPMPKWLRPLWQDALNSLGEIKTVATMWN